MEKTSSQIKDILYTTLYAKDIQQLKSQLNFYLNDLNLKLKEEVKNKSFFLISDDNVIFKIVINQQDKDNKIIKHNDLCTDDNWWNSIDTALVFKVSSFEKLVEKLTNLKRLIKYYPCSEYYNLIYTMDPLGYVIGFEQGSKFMSSFYSSRIVLNRKYNFSQFIETHSNCEKSIAVMTSGGDSSGMNAFVRAVVRSAIIQRCKAYAILEGYEGMVKGTKKYIKRLNWEDVNGFIGVGGTNIGTARCKSFKTREGRLAACKNLISFGIDSLIICGGDGSLTGADIFKSEWSGLINDLKNSNQISEVEYKNYTCLKVCGAVGSIDNDMSNTDATIGAYSSLNIICSEIDFIYKSLYSERVVFIIEVMGRSCGWLALMAGISNSADYIFIPEKPCIGNWKQELCERIKKSFSLGKNKALVIVSEGAVTNDLTPIHVKKINETIVHNLSVKTKISTLGHIQRGGNPVSYDRMLATLQGFEAVLTVLNMKNNDPLILMAISNNELKKTNLQDSIKKNSMIVDATKRKDFNKILELRGNEFKNNYKFYKQINSLSDEFFLPENKRLKIALIHIGSCSGCIKSMIHFLARYCFVRGHKLLLIKNGFEGLEREDCINTLDPSIFLDLTLINGSLLESGFMTPMEVGIDKVAFYFNKYNISGLLVIGGILGIECLSQLEQKKETFLPFRIPMILIPSSLYNNVPGSNYSLGFETSVNSLMEYCDIIKQSASATRNRVFVIEIDCENNGYVLVYLSIICAAHVVYIPEEDIKIQHLQSDIDFLKRSFINNDLKNKSGKLVLKAVNSSKYLNSYSLAKIIEFESNGLFDVKTAIPGPINQNINAFSTDRIKSLSSSINAISYIEQKYEELSKINYSILFSKKDDLLNLAAVLNCETPDQKWTPIKTLCEMNEKKILDKTEISKWSTLKKFSYHLNGKYYLMN